MPKFQVVAIHINNGEDNKQDSPEFTPLLVTEAKNEENAIVAAMFYEQSMDQMSKIIALRIDSDNSSESMPYASFVVAYDSSRSSNSELSEPNGVYLESVGAQKTLKATEMLLDLYSGRSINDSRDIPPVNWAHVAGKPNETNTLEEYLFDDRFAVDGKPSKSVMGAYVIVEIETKKVSVRPITATHRVA